MTVQERSEIARLRECVQELALQVARLSQAVEPLVRMQEDQNELRDQVAELQGFKSAVVWLVGLVGATAVIRYAVLAWTGGGR